MTALDLLPVGAGTQQWPLWSTTARLVVREPSALPDARRVVDGVLTAVERACSRFQPSELDQVEGSANHTSVNHTAVISPLLAELVRAALSAAELTDGDVDPTLGTALADLGYDRDIEAVRTAGISQSAGTSLDVPIIVRRVPAWRDIRLNSGVLTLPVGVRLDLGAIAKAFAADRCAQLVAAYCHTDVLVSLGGDIATVGDGWSVLVSDGPDEPECTVTLNGALATSSTIGRTWRRAGRLLHHILDPRTLLPARPVWRTVSVAAPTCVEANTWSTAAIVRGEAAPEMLRRLGLPARLVGRNGDVRTIGAWPS